MTNVVMASLARKTRMMVSFLFFLVLSAALCVGSTPGVAKEGSTVISFPKTPDGTTSNALMQSAIEYAKDHYGIDVLITTELLHEQVAPWNNTALPANKWAARVFKSFDKIVYYDGQGRLESIKILGLKNITGTSGRNNHITSGTQVRGTRIAKAENSLPARDATFFSPSDTQEAMEEMVPDKTTGSQQPPEGVTIYAADESAERADPQM